MNLREVLERAETVKPIGEVNGVQLVSFQDQVDLAQADVANKADMGLVEFNPDGTVAHSKFKYAAVNVEHYFRNRVKQVKDKLYVVRDYRAISEQASGRVYSKLIPAYVIGRNKDGELALEKIVNVSDDEFIADFTNTLNRESMEQILPLLEGGVSVTQVGIGI